jgi:hypothetical protein
MKKIIILLLFAMLIFADDLPIQINKCGNSSNNIISKFIIPDLQNLKKLGFNLITKDTIYDTGSLIVYIPNLNVYYITKRNSPSIRYDGEIYKLIGYDCIDTLN